MRLGTRIGWDYTLCLDRPVFNLGPRVTRTGQLSAADEIIDRYKLDTIFLDSRNAHDAKLARYFARRYGAGRQVGPLRVWRVRPTSEKPKP